LVPTYIFDLEEVLILADNRLGVGPVASDQKPVLRLHAQAVFVHSQAVQLGAGSVVRQHLELRARGGGGYNVLVQLARVLEAWHIRVL
jgi:hypothetical protein